MTAIVNYRPAEAVDYDRELRGAHALMKSGLAPAGLKSAEAAMFVILAGRDLGLSPVASLRGLFVVNGKLEVSADLQLGLFHKAGGKSRWLEITATAARVELSAPWLTAPHVSSFTMEDAKRAGLANNATYSKFPKAMLRSRAITQGLKDVGFEPTAGCYAPGEIGGEVIVEGDAVSVHAPLEMERVTETSTTAPEAGNLTPEPTLAPVNGQPPKAETDKTFIIDEADGVFSARGEGTYKARDDLKKLGFRWNKDDKVWQTEDRDAAEKASRHALCRNPVHVPLDQEPDFGPDDDSNPLPF